MDNILTFPTARRTQTDSPVMPSTDVASEVHAVLEFPGTKIFYDRFEEDDDLAVRFFERLTDRKEIAIINQGPNIRGNSLLKVGIGTLYVDELFVDEFIEFTAVHPNQKIAQQDKEAYMLRALASLEVNAQIFKSEQITSKRAMFHEKNIHLFDLNSFKVAWGKTDHVA